MPATASASWSCGRSGYTRYLLGSGIGAAWALYKIVHHTAHHGAGQTLGWWLNNCALAVLMVPDILTRRTVFPFNLPAWSLFYEVAINVIYGFTARRTSDRVLLGVVAGSAAVLAVATVRLGNMHFTVHMPVFLLGGMRAVFGFYVGVGIQRLWQRGRLPRWNVPPLALAALLLACLAIPREGPAAIVLTLLVVFVAFPLIVITALYNEPGGPMARIALQLGLLSFPVYAIHRPIHSIILYLAHRHHLSAMVTALCAIVPSLVLAWLALRFYDQPVRRWLTRKAIMA